MRSGGEESVRGLCKWAEVKRERQGSEEVGCRC